MQPGTSAAIASAVAGAASALSASEGAAGPTTSPLGITDASPSGDAAAASQAPALVKPIATDMGSKVLDAAHSFAAMTDFEGTGSKSTSLGGADRGSTALGSAVFNRLKRFDRTYLQPVFGRDGASLELPEGREERDRDSSKDDSAPT